MGRIGDEPDLLITDARRRNIQNNCSEECLFGCDAVDGRCYSMSEELASCSGDQICCGGGICPCRDGHIVINEQSFCEMGLYCSDGDSGCGASQRCSDDCTGVQVCCLYHLFRCENGTLQRSPSDWIESCSAGKPFRGCADGASSCRSVTGPIVGLVFASIVVVSIFLLIIAIPIIVAIICRRKRRAKKEEEEEEEKIEGNKGFGLCIGIWILSVLSLVTIAALIALSVFSPAYPAILAPLVVVAFIVLHIEITFIVIFRIRMCDMAAAGRQMKEQQLTGADPADERRCCCQPEFLVLRVLVIVIPYTLAWSVLVMIGAGVSSPFMTVDYFFIGVIFAVVCGVISFALFVNLVVVARRCCLLNPESEKGVVCVLILVLSILAGLGIGIVLVSVVIAAIGGIFSFILTDSLAYLGLSMFLVFGVISVVMLTTLAGLCVHRRRSLKAVQQDTMPMIQLRSEEDRNCDKCEEEVSEEEDESFEEVIDEYEEEDDESFQEVVLVEYVEGSEDSESLTTEEESFEEVVGEE